MLFNKSIKFASRIDGNTLMPDFILIEGKNNSFQGLSFKNRKPHLFKIESSEFRITMEYTIDNIEMISSNMDHVKSLIVLQAFTHLKDACDGKKLLNLTDNVENTHVNILLNFAAYSPFVFGKFMIVKRVDNQLPKDIMIGLHKGNYSEYDKALNNGLIECYYPESSKVSMLTLESYQLEVLAEYSNEDVMLLKKQPEHVHLFQLLIGHMILETAFYKETLIEYSQEIVNCSFIKSLLT